MYAIRLSQLFTKTSKTHPADETARNAQLLIQAGYVHKEMAGVYAFLPLGLQVLENIKQIIREEMDAIGGNEVSMTALQNRELWEKTDRWDDKKVDNWFKTTLANGSMTGLGITHEEPVTNMMRAFVSSYKDLPAYPYQFQTKFRNELRAKSGVMRGREFVMKDLYSFSRTEEERAAFYEKAAEAYTKVFDRLGIGATTYRTFASGGIFSKFSEEFQTVSEVGEDTIYVHEVTKVAVNKEVYSDDVLEELGLKKDELVEKRAIEVGNIFQLGTKFSEPLGLNFTDEDGTQKPVIMGSYGIGPSRLVGVLAEYFADEKGLVWPKSVAPAQVYIATVGNDSEVVTVADDLYHTFQEQNISVIYDDRDERPGGKFADSDLLGIPYRVVISPKMVEQSSFELKERTADEAQIVSREELLNRVKF
jgi:prolyl-tRNA synthetase